MSSSREEFSIRFRTRKANGLLLLASDSTTTIVSGYTVLEVGPIGTFKQCFTTILEVVSNQNDVFAQSALLVFPRFTVYD